MVILIQWPCTGLDDCGRCRLVWYFPAQIQWAQLQITPDQMGKGVSRRPLLRPLSLKPKANEVVEKPSTHTTHRKRQGLPFIQILVCQVHWRLNTLCIYNTKYNMSNILMFIIKHNYFGYGTVGLPKISISIVLLCCLLYRSSREVFDFGCRLGYSVHFLFYLFHLSAL